MEEVTKNKNKYELIKFIITGIVCALLDYLTCQLFLRICAPMNETWRIIISNTCGFIVGVIGNYFLSTYWVFKGKKDEKTVKSPLFITKFVILSIVACLLSIGTMVLCQIICQEVWNVEISNDQLQKIFTFTFWDDVVFWAYFISFCLKTLIGLIWNYLTRKYILYKEEK